MYRLMTCILCVLIAVIPACVTKQVTTNPDGTVTEETKLNVEETCFVIRTAINMGLPLAIENFDGDTVKHVTLALQATNSLLTFLKTNETTLTEELLNKELEQYTTTLSSQERLAIQSGLSLILHLVKTNVDAKGNVNQDVVKILSVLFTECQKIFELYSNQKKTELPAKLQYKRQ